MGSVTSMLQSSLEPIISPIGGVLADIGYFKFTIGFMWSIYLIDTYIDYRQYKCIKNSTYNDLNKLLKSHFPKEGFEKSQEYAKDKAHYSLIKGLYGQIKQTLYITALVTPWFWTLSRSVASSYGFQGEYYETAVFLTITSLFELIIGQPWSLYSTFVLEEKHGFNKMSLGFYIKDTIKKFIVWTPINALIVSGIIWTINSFDNFYFYAFGFVSLIMFVMMYIYPEFIAPLFDKYSPLEEGDLKTKIEELASSLEFPLTKLFVVDGSTRSNHSNAYMYGFRNNKRIVLFDTLINSYMETKEDSKGKGCETPEILSILGHELGHWKMNHTVKMLVIQEALIFGVFYTFSKFIGNDAMFAAFGFSGDAAPGVYLKLLVVLQTVMAPMFEVFGIGMIQFIRHNEFEADRFAVQINRGDYLESGLAKLYKDNASFPLCDPVYAWRHHSHPHFDERVTELKRQLEIHQRKKQ